MTMTVCNHRVTMWDEESQSMKEFAFHIDVDLSKVAIKNFQSARHNKSGKRKLIGGAFTIKFVK